MVNNKKNKEYSAPQLELVRQDETNRVFFATSGSEPTVFVKSMMSTKGEW